MTSDIQAGKLFNLFLQRHQRKLGTHARMKDDLFFRLARSEGHQLPETTKILDFGCGAGDYVRQCLAAGYDAWGTDLTVDADQERLRAIREPYALPFADDSFDLIVSHQVFEHIRDTELACRELARVLRPGGLSIHVFPSRFRLIEPHTYVPLASFHRPTWWLSTWARLGVRNEHQQGLSWHETSEHNRRYLDQETNYLTRPAILNAFAKSFAEVRFIEHRLMEASRRIPGPLKKPAVPVLARTYSALYQRILLAR